MGLLHGLSRRFWYAHQRDLVATAKRHADIMRAVAAGDEAQAEAAADRLIDSVEASTRTALDFRDVHHAPRR